MRPSRSELYRSLERRNKGIRFSLSREGPVQIEDTGYLLVPAGETGERRLQLKSLRFGFRDNSDVPAERLKDRRAR